MKKKFVDPRYAKSGEYAKVIEKIAGSGYCPFCHENFHHHKHKIIKLHQGWFLTKCSWPYPNTKLHLLLIVERHKESLTQLSNNDWLAISYLVKLAIKKFKIKGGGLMMRFGQTKYTGATVKHLHAHLVVPKLKNKSTAMVVNFPIG
ncbi:MAG: HIT domain-containing protein [bacterium]